MSTAFAFRDLRLLRADDYQPVSAGSLAIKDTWEREQNYLRRSASDWTPLIEAGLGHIRSECGRADWDGEGAAPINDRTIDLTVKIVTTLFALLPKGTPAPDLIPESDGEICISWTFEDARIFSASVGEHGKVNFSGQFGSEGGVHAWQRIDATNRSKLENSLEDLVRYISRLCAPTTVVRRAA
jgi:hypothetical protein